jgi:hypothetical protein
MVAAHRVDGFVCRPHDLVPVVLRFFDSLASSLRNILLHAGPKTISASTRLHGRSYRVTLEYASDHSTERGRPATKAHHVSSVIARHETTATTDHPVKVVYLRAEWPPCCFWCEQSAHEGRPQPGLRLNVSLWFRR